MPSRRQRKLPAGNSVCHRRY